MRAASVSMLQSWDERLSRSASAARKIGEGLSFYQSQSLWLQGDVEIAHKFKDPLISVIPELGEQDIPEADGKFTLPARFSPVLRWELVAYLNSLETVLSAWHHDIVDREMIEQQFEHVVRHDDGRYLLKEFRKAAGGASTYPCIESCVGHLESRRAGRPAMRSAA